MPTARFHLTSSLSAPEVLAVLTDFSPRRPDAWPTIDAEHFQVHGIGENWAEVTEGTEASWERAHYEWDATRNQVDITTLDSKIFGPGGGWVFRLTPQGTGTRIDVELTRAPHGLKARMLGALLPVVAPASFRKAFSGPLQAVA
ncbi:hypothetical protein [Cellulosimicrobium sp. CUA-896]|uniref:hypothetical protein n=1 Tax=Cellulosimicrobium sp. CUA-896 TaxID=1517881 RepID=UPI00095E6167|nr:hypothetical protein [Cellulosimicrobium sp. CUA-896]OLT46128.1 hypothetical protein BJF88_04725 [Cellulosimicrobium sp. CUA-896]